MTISIPKFDEITILVVGDVMLDKYWQGSATRISPEAPVPIVHVQDSHAHPGGAGNVALNLKALGCKAILLGLVGDDEAGRTLVADLEQQGVNCYLQVIPDQPTVTKLRVLGKNQQLIRLDFEQNFNKVAKDALITNFEHLLQQADAVIFSDYGKGTLAAVEEMINKARSLKKLVFVDPKTKDFSCYQGASLITPNLKEFEAVVGHCESEKELVAKAQTLIHQHDLEALLITQGGQGMILVYPDAPPLQLKAHASEVYDVSGAGDTVISVLAASIAAGCHYNTAATLANMAAGIVVRKLGAASVSIPELRRALRRQYGSDLGILQEEDLLVAIEDAKAHGETIVMTNGCFDLLHAGHIAYLEEAKNLGDRLIVAVNDDNSVKQLKGSSRPINSLQDRMKLLSALRCVDWVISFSEDTPERLISRLLPHILVKGGDYSVNAIAGSVQVLANGGQVKILSFIQGYSTTLTIKKMQEVEECIS